MFGRVWKSHANGLAVSDKQARRVARFADAHHDAALYGDAAELGMHCLDGKVVGILGIGEDITKASMDIWNAAVEKAYGGERKIAWMEIYAGEKANDESLTG